MADRPRPTNNPPAACKLAGAAAAYAAGDNALGERLFNAGWSDHQTIARHVARGILRDPSLTDDALQIASLKVWKSVKSGYAPTHGWRAIVKTAAHHGAVQQLDRRIRYRADEMPLFDNPETADAAQHRALELAGAVDPDMAMSLEGVAQEAERRFGRKGKLWAAIIREVAKGHVDRETIALALGKPAGTIRREIFNINRTDLYESITKREQVVDWRSLTATDRLFDFEYADI